MKKNTKKNSDKNIVTPIDEEVEILSDDEGSEHQEEMDLLDDAVDLEEEGDIIDVVDPPALALSTLPTPTGTRDSLHLYLKEVSRFPMLKPDEDQILAQRVRS